MKILFTQLTRFGDILCTLPVVSAVRRKYPDAEIHFLARSRFSGAAQLSPHINKLWQWRSDAIVGPFLDQEKPRALQQTEALQALKASIIALKREQFDIIYNFSFSPSSSYITHMIASPHTEVFGYSRTADFFLFIPDDMSRYFRSQVGTEKSNRIHVYDLFAMIARVDLLPSDVRLMPAPPSGRQGIVCHLGASQETKSWTPQSWYAFLRKLTAKHKLPITLVGAESEREFAEQIALQVDEPQFLRNLVGETSFEELIHLMSRSALFVGADSGPLHAANLAGCPSLNLSLGPVRFWETGPTVPGSRVLVRDLPGHLTSEDVLKHADEMILNIKATEGCAECIDMGGIRYKVHPKSMIRTDEWEMIEWLYFDGMPPRMGEDVRLALAQILDVAVLAIDLVESLEKDPKRVEVVGVLDRIDEVLKMIESSYPLLRPLLWRFVVERENNPPGSREQVFEHSKTVYRNLLKRANSLMSGEVAMGKDL